MALSRGAAAHLAQQNELSTVLWPRIALFSMLFLVFSAERAAHPKCPPYLGKKT